MEDRCQKQARPKVKLPASTVTFGPIPTRMNTRKGNEAFALLYFQRIADGCDDMASTLEKASSRGESLRKDSKEYYNRVAQKVPWDVIVRLMSDPGDGKIRFNAFRFLSVYAGSTSFPASFSTAPRLIDFLRIFGESNEEYHPVIMKIFSAMVKKRPEVRNFLLDAGVIAMIKRPSSESSEFLVRCISQKPDMAPVHCNAINEVIILSLATGGKSIVCPLLSWFGENVESFWHNPPIFGVLYERLINATDSVVVSHVVNILYRCQAIDAAAFGTRIRYADYLAFLVSTFNRFSKQSHCNLQALTIKALIQCLPQVGGDDLRPICEVFMNSMKQLPFDLMVLCTEFVVSWSAMRSIVDGAVIDLAIDFAGHKSIGSVCCGFLIGALHGGDKEKAKIVANACIPRIVDLEDASSGCEDDGICAVLDKIMICVSRLADP